MEEKGRSFDLLILKQLTGFFKDGPGITNPNLDQGKAGIDGPWLQVAMHDRASGNHSALTDSHTRQDHGIGEDERVRADDDFISGDHTKLRWDGWIGKPILQALAARDNPNADRHAREIVNKAFATPRNAAIKGQMDVAANSHPQTGENANPFVDLSEIANFNMRATNKSAAPINTNLSANAFKMPPQGWHGDYSS
jgi:hypothetical protein